MAPTLATATEASSRSRTLPSAVGRSHVGRAALFGRPPKRPLAPGSGGFPWDLSRPFLHCRLEAAHPRDPAQVDTEQDDQRGSPPRAGCARRRPMRSAGSRPQQRAGGQAGADQGHPSHPQESPRPGAQPQGRGGRHRPAGRFRQGVGGRNRGAAPPAPAPTDQVTEDRQKINPIEPAPAGPAAGATSNHRLTAGQPVRQQAHKAPQGHAERAHIDGQIDGQQRVQVVISWGYRDLVLTSRSVTKPFWRSSLRERSSVWEPSRAVV